MTQLVIKKLSPVILIPVYNGRDSVITLVEAVQALVDWEILVIDDGSDTSLEGAFPASVRLIRHAENRGKGAALRTGLDYVYQAGFSHAVTLDADGQHAPERLEAFFEASQSNPSALIVGSRDLVNHSMPVHRRFSNNVTSLLISLRIGMLVRDSQVGYRCYPLKYRSLWNSSEDGFQFESDIFLRAAKLRLGLRWVDIPVIYGELGSHMNLWRDTLKFIRMYILSLIRI